MTELIRLCKLSVLIFFIPHTGNDSRSSSLTVSLFGSDTLGDSSAAEETPPVSFYFHLLKSCMFHQTFLYLFIRKLPKLVTLFARMVTLDTTGVPNMFLAVRILHMCVLYIGNKK